MKKITALLTALALILGLCACSQTAGATWQEQYDLGVRYLSEGNYREAIIAFNAAIEIDPKQPEVYLNLADAYMALGDLDSALQALRDGYAATGDARLQARIDELTAPEPTAAPAPTPTPTPTPTPAPTPTPEVSNITWSLVDGTLTISGTGQMEDYRNADNRPWYEDCGSITKVVIEDGVTSIGSYAFHYCSSLTSVTIPTSVTSIGSLAFTNCSSLASITIPTSVTNIETGAFSDCSSLASVTIPTSVTSIGSFAFSDCSSLASINVASENPAYVSVGGVLFNADQTLLHTYPAGKRDQSYNIPASVTKIDFSAFSGCSSLTSVTIPTSVTSIDSYAFCDCSNLTNVTIPDSVTSIGYHVFFHCSSLASVTIPVSVISIGDGAFWDCSSLTSVTIPNSVTSIGDWAFAGCDLLTSVTIPNSVTSIGEWAFYGCYDLKDVYYNGSEVQWNQIAIGDENEKLLNATIHFNS